MHGGIFRKYWESEKFVSAMTPLALPPLIRDSGVASFTPTRVPYVVGLHLGPSQDRDGLWDSPISKRGYAGKVSAIGERGLCDRRYIPIYVRMSRYLSIFMGTRIFINIMLSSMSDKNSTLFIPLF